ncbi:MAG: cation transporter [Clostridia bacterium]|nr:cation transporter [Clostridia bacterium]
MKKIFNIEVDCAVCAGKVEQAISKIDGVKEVSINFITQKLAIEADEADFARIIKEARIVGKRIEPDFVIE